MYSKSELIQAADKLGYPRSLVAAALEKIDKKISLTEAKKIIKAFAERKVS